MCNVLLDALRAQPVRLRLGSEHAQQRRALPHHQSTDEARLGMHVQVSRAQHGCMCDVLLDALRTRPVRLRLGSEHAQQRRALTHHQSTDEARLGMHVQVSRAQHAELNMGECAMSS